MRLKGKYKEIWDLATPYLEKCRWWDLWHTEMSVDFMYQILRGEGIEDLGEVLVPSIILHDIGWSTIGEKKNVSWGDKEMRVKHMEVGAEIAKQILERVSYNPKLINKIIQLVSTHDNAYLGIEQTTTGEKLVRDADACFVLTDLSFWNYYHVKSVIKGEKITPKESLDELVEKNSKRHTETAQRIANRQIVDRTKEIANTSKTPLQRYEELRSEARRRSKVALAE